MHWRRLDGVSSQGSQDFTKLYRKAFYFGGADASTLRSSGNVRVPGHKLFPDKGLLEPTASFRLCDTQQLLVWQIQGSTPSFWTRSSLGEACVTVQGLALLFDSHAQLTRTARKRVPLLFAWTGPLGRFSPAEHLSCMRVRMVRMLEGISGYKRHVIRLKKQILNH